jgi:hypothetical protein
VTQLEWPLPLPGLVGSDLSQVSVDLFADSSHLATPQRPVEALEQFHFIDPATPGKPLLRLSLKGSELEFLPELLFERQHELALFDNDSEGGDRHRPVSLRRQVKGWRPLQFSGDTIQRSRLLNRGGLLGTRFGLAEEDRQEQSARVPWRLKA